MATYTQTAQSVTAANYNYIVSQVEPGEDYIIFSNDTYIYGVVGKYDASSGNFTDTTIYRIARSNANGQVTKLTETSTKVNISYDLYSYSNIGTGTYIALPDTTTNTQTTINYISGILLILVLFLIGFNVIKKRWVM